jgi:putative polyhydroxyalkanoate system protein
VARTLRLSVPHNLTQEQARARIQSGITKLRQQYGNKASAISETWTQDHLDFELTAMGQQVRGQLDVHAQDVALQLELPWMLGMLAGRIEKEVEREGRKLLE